MKCSAKRRWICRLSFSGASQERRSSIASSGLHSCPDAHPCLLPPAGGVQALDVTVSQSNIQVARGQAAVLPCSFTTSAALTNLNIIWMVIPLSNANQPEQVGASPPLTNSPLHLRVSCPTNLCSLTDPAPRGPLRCFTSPT